MPESAEQNTRLEALLARLVEETITGEEFAELETLLSENSAAQQRYLHYLALHADLQEAGAHAEIESTGSDARGGRRWSSAAMLGVAAAAAALVVAIILLVQPGPKSAGQPRANLAVPPVIAKIGELNGSVAWTGDGGQVDYHLDVDDWVTGGTLETLAANSWAEIIFHDGSTVWVSGAGALTLSENESGKLIRLRRGDLSMDVSPQEKGRPLRLETPTAQAEVLGTQFNVTADASSTRVTVNEGVVRVTRLADGKVQDVAADHHVVAALEQETNFLAVPRGQHVEIWRSELPRDARQGHWQPGKGDDPGALRAEAHLFRGDEGEREEPILLHSAVVGPSVLHHPPILLTEGARFRIKGRLARSHRVSFGFGTHHARGGLAGKYDTWRRIEIDEDAGGTFEIELALNDFPRMKNRFPESPVGHEISWLWIQTVKEDAGLEVISVELLESEEPD